MPSIKAPPLNIGLSFIAGTHCWLRLRHHIFKQTALIPPGLWEEQGSEEATMLLRFRAPFTIHKCLSGTIHVPSLMLEFKVGSQDQTRTVTAIDSLVEVARH